MENQIGDQDWQIMAEYNLPSLTKMGERAAERIAYTLQEPEKLYLPFSRLMPTILEASTAALLNCDETQRRLPITLRVWKSKTYQELTHSGPQLQSFDSPLQPIPGSGGHNHSETQSGWGFFLVKKSLMDIRHPQTAWHQCLEIFLYCEGKYAEVSRE